MPVFFEPAPQVKRASRDQHAVTVRPADAVEGPEERGATSRLGLVEERALLALAAHEAGERHAEMMQCHAARELAPQQVQR